jgi:type I restriction enzyme S subunit
MDYLDRDFSELPDNWTIHPLRDVAEIHNARRAPLNERERQTKKGIYPYCGANGVVDSIDEYRFDGEFVLIAEDGGYWGKNEPSSYIMRGKFWVNNHAHVIRERNGISNNLFLSCQLNFMDMSPLIGGDARGKLTKSILERLPLVLPPLTEQRKIAVVLRLVQRTIEQQERLLALTTELKTTLLYQFFTHGLRNESQKETEIGFVPKSWEQRVLEEMGEVVYGIQAAVAANLKPVGTKILTNKNISLDGRILLDSINYFVLKTDRHLATLLRKGDLLFNWRSGSKEHVGKTAYFDLDGEFTHSSFILRIRPCDEVTGRFLFYYLNFLRESGYFVKTQTFAVNAKFNKSAINRLSVYLPCEDERRDIVTALDVVQKKIEATREKNRLLNDLFRTLLHHLMTAQIRVSDVDLSALESAVPA